MRAEERHRVGRPRAAGRERVRPPVPMKRPRVVGVDAQVRIATGRLGHQLDELAQVEVEGDQQHDRQQEPDPPTRTRRGARPLFPYQPAAQAAPATRRGARSRARREQVAAQQHDGDERGEHHPELRLDQARHRRPSPRRPRSRRTNSSATPSSMTSAPTASIWPQSAESYQVTGLNRYSAAAPSARPRALRRVPSQPSVIRYSRQPTATSARIGGSLMSAVVRAAASPPASGASRSAAHRRATARTGSRAGSRSKRRARRSRRGRTRPSSAPRR